MIQLEEKVLEHDSAIEEKVMNIKLGALSSNKQDLKGTVVNQKVTSN